MIAALAMNRAQFLTLFLEYGFFFEKMKNKNILEFLYGYCMNSSTSILKMISNFKFSCAAMPQEDHEIPDCGNVMRILCEDAGLDINECAVDLKDVHKLVDSLCSGIRQGSTLLSEVSHAIKTLIMRNILVIF